MQENEISEKAKEHGKTANMVGYLLIGKFISFFLLAAAFIIVVRILGPSVYGVYVIAIAVGGFFGAVGNFGVATMTTKFVSEYKAKNKKEGIENALANSFMLLSIIGIILMLVMIAFSGVLSNIVFHSSAYVYIIDIASVIIITGMLSNASVSALVGLDKSKHVSIAIITLAIIQSGVSILLAVLGFGATAPLVGLILGYIVSFSIALYYIYVPNKLKVVKPTRAGLAKIFKNSSPLAASNVLTNTFTNLVPIVLGIVATTAIVGNFGIASRASNFLDIVSGSIGMSLIPMFAGSIAKGESKKMTGKLYTYSVYFSFVFLMPMLMLLLVLAKPFSFTVFSGVYTLAPEYIMIFSAGFIIGIVGSYTTQLLISANKVKTVLKNNAMIFAIELLLIPIIVELKGEGASLLLFVVAPLLVDIFFVREIKKYFKVGFKSKMLVRVVLANLAIGAVMALMLVGFGGNNIPLIITAIVFVLIAYPPILALTKGITKKELFMIKKISGSIPIVGGLLNWLARYSERFASEVLE